MNAKFKCAICGTRYDFDPGRCTNPFCREIAIVHLSSREDSQGASPKPESQGGGHGGAVVAAVITVVLLLL